MNYPCPICGKSMRPVGWEDGYYVDHYIYTCQCGFSTPSKDSFQEAAKFLDNCFYMKRIKMLEEIIANTPIPPEEKKQSELTHSKVKNYKESADVQSYT